MDQKTRRRLVCMPLLRLQVFGQKKRDPPKQRIVEKPVYTEEPQRTSGPSPLISCLESLGKSIAESGTGGLTISREYSSSEAAAGIVRRAFNEERKKLEAQGQTFIY